MSGNTIGTSNAEVPMLSPEESAKLRTDALSTEASVLAANTSFDDIPEESHKTVICYNPNCKQYRVERRDGSSCDCKITRVKGAGDARGGW